MSGVSEMKVAVTGVIGSGKSTVSSYIKELGYPLINADEVNAGLLEDSAVQEDIVKLLDLPFFDKKEISGVVFNDPGKKKLLEDYLHPLIKDKIRVFFKKNKGLCFAEVPLLFEAGWQDEFDYSICVVSYPKRITERLMKERHMSKEEIKARMNSQLSQKEKAERSDFVLKNYGGLELLKKRTEELIERLEND